tara:strand:+ start:625 stop:996 length:372 start_codon:yes stop_codon:yes gene_type:complete
MKIEVSNGELLDKISILAIKEDRLVDEAKKSYVSKELRYLMELGDDLLTNHMINYNRLLVINMELWDIEDEIRAKGEADEFDERFIELSRWIYEKNDERARIKNNIDRQSDSEFREQKGHKTV